MITVKSNKTFRLLGIQTKKQFVKKIIIMLLIIVVIKEFFQGNMN